MNKNNTAITSNYGEKYQLKQADKYRDRNNNHWKYRIELAHKLVNSYVLPRLSDKNCNKIVAVDIGCSIGTFAIEFAKLGYNSYGIDYDKEAIKIAEQLCKEEKVSPKLICGDFIIHKQDLPPIDIAICFDIFEHLHDDEIGFLLQSIRAQLSKEGSIIFHTFPTQYDYIFFDKFHLELPLFLFNNLSSSKFNLILKIYASLIDIGLLLIKGKTYRELIKFSSHCNPTTKDRLTAIFNRAGYNILFIDSLQLYPSKKFFSNQKITQSNLYGIAIPNKSLK